MDPYDVKYFRMISRREIDDSNLDLHTSFVIQLLHMPLLCPKFLDILTNYLEFNTINLDN